MAGKCYICGLYGRTSVHHRRLRDRVWKRSTCARSERNLSPALRSSAPSPPAHSRDRRSADSASRRLFTLGGRGAGGRKAERARCAPRRPKRSVQGTWNRYGVRAGRQATPKSRGLGPAEMRPDLPTRPGRLQLREPSPSSAPHSPLTLARTAEPGNRDRCCCRMPSGPSATGDRGPGASSGGGRGGRAGGRRRASSSVAAETRREVKVWQSEGRRPGGGGSASRPAPPLPAPPGPTVPTEERPPPARHGSALGALLQMPFCLGLSPAVRPASRRRWHSLKDP